MADILKCQWFTLKDAMQSFVLASRGHQSAEHIKPLHWYTACRLVLKGGFKPDEITPRPPFVASRRGREWILNFDVKSAGAGERTVFGGLKTKSIDVVVAKEGIGPVLAVSLKGTVRSFRNLTNRMEEAAGDCTNLHIAYPALVYGFWNLLRANAPGRIPKNAYHIFNVKRGIEEVDVDVTDLALMNDGEVASSIVRYHQALEGLTGRTGVRDDVSKYEAVALTLVSPDANTLGEVVQSYPREHSALRIDGFFEALYREYDLRFVYGAPALETTTRRIVWSPLSPVLEDKRIKGFNARIGQDQLE